MKKHILLFISIFAITTYAFSQNKDELREQIIKATEGKQALVGVCLAIDGDTLTINNNYHFPTQSVYKFHLAFAVLDHMHKKNLKLNQQLFINKSELLPNTHSPLRDTYPEGNFYMDFADIIKYMVSKSDNNACDILFRFVGGTEATDKYIRSLGLTDFAIAATEEEMHTTWDTQFKNWTTPYSATKLLEMFKSDKILPEPFRNFLWEAMVETSTGNNKIKGLLPKNTIVAHKAGSSFRNEAGVKAAENDIAIIQLPNGRDYSLAIFITDSKENDETNALIIAQISKVIYDYLLIY